MTEEEHAGKKWKEGEEGEVGENRRKGRHITMAIDANLIGKATRNIINKMRNSKSN